MKKMNQKVISTTKTGRRGRPKISALPTRPRIVKVADLAKAPDEPTHGELVELETKIHTEPAPEKPHVPVGDRLDMVYHLYLREIGQIKLLTPREEIELAARIKQGDEEAREHMIKANLRLVVKIARDYDGVGLPLLDLINEGNIGLMKAVERFDPAKGAKLSTYAAWWIKQSIKRALANQSKTIRLPVHVVDKLAHIRRAEATLHDLLGRQPTDEELGENVGLTAVRVAELRLASIRPASLEAPLGDEDSSRISDVVADERADDPYEQLEEKTVSEMLHTMVAGLNPREAEILRYRFGLDGEEEKTLEEVGERYGVTRERIRQIQEMALKKLRRKIQDLETVEVAA